MVVLKRAARLSWITVALLAASCCVLAVLQYRWISEFAEAERTRLATDLRSRLDLVARSFNEQVSAALSDLNRRTSPGQDPLFRRVGRATAGENGLSLALLNFNTGEFSPADWPAEWSGERDRLEARWEHRPGPPADSNAPVLVEQPRFAPEGGQAWIVAELDLNRVRQAILPELLNRYVRTSGKLEYDWDLSRGRADPSADASIALLGGQAPGPRPPDRNPEHDPRGGPRPFPERDSRGGRPGFSGPPPEFNPTPLRLELRHHAGSLEAFVSQAKWRNVATSAGLLLLIVGAVLALLRASRESQKLAAAQMNFVAGVSHELRTPLTVIRTAAYNLRRNLAHRPEQVEQYGELIQEQSEKLTALVEQVLRFARSEAGHVIGACEPVRVDDLIGDSLQFLHDPLRSTAIEVEKNLAPGLPPLLADPAAIKHALQNLIENAVKHGTAGSDWLGISATGTDGFVEIRIADRGPGIPEDEQPHIFDPFFRGRRALSNQVHGTGLGLSLTRKIVEAHGGSIRVESQPPRGTEFIVRVPAARREWSRELAHSAG